MMLFQIIQEFHNSKYRRFENSIVPPLFTIQQPIVCILEKMHFNKRTTFEQRGLDKRGSDKRGCTVPYHTGQASGNRLVCTVCTLPASVFLLSFFFDSQKSIRCVTHRYENLLLASKKIIKNETIVYGFPISACLPIPAHCTYFR